MKKLSVFVALMGCVLGAALQAGAIVPELDDSTALGDFTAARNGVLNELPDILTGEITLAARFNPDVSQATGGPIIVIENGGTSNGTGLYLANGHLIFAAKAANGRFSIPTSLNDTDFSNDGSGKAMAVDLGPINFGLENKVYVSMDLNRGKLFASVNGTPTWYTITGANGTENLDGNRSVSFLGVSPISDYGWLGGLLEAGETTFPFLFWTNAAPMVQTAGYTNQRGQIFDKAVVPRTLPHDPSPADGAIAVDPAEVTALSFYTGDDPENPGSPNPAITGHWVTIFSVQNGEPNFLAPPLEVSPLIPAGTEPAIYEFTFSLTEDQSVFWQVEEQIDGFERGDPNNIVGLIWSFETIKSVPIISGQPVNAMVGIGQTAVFSLDVISISPPSFEWYKSADNATDTPLDDVLVGAEQTLTLENVQASDEGYYYCKVINASGEQNAAYSTVVKLGVKRKVAHWTLDWADYVDGLYLDSSGEGHHAEPNAVLDQSQFVPGVDPLKTAEGLNIAANPAVAADTGIWSPSTLTGEVTVSAWVKWAGTNGAWQGIVSNRNTPADGNFYFEMQPGGAVQFNTPYITELVAPGLPVDQWTHVAVTAGADGIVISFDGQPVATRPTVPAITELGVPLYIGALQRNEGVLASPFNGVLDDVRIYNYAMDQFEVADLYYAISETPACLNPEGVDLRFDVTGDCRVGLDDFAMFAGTWLNCGLYPQNDCP